MKIGKYDIQQRSSLAGWATRRAIEPLIGALLDPDGTVVLAAAGALTELDDPSTVAHACRRTERPRRALVAVNARSATLRSEGGACPRAGHSAASGAAGQSPRSLGGRSANVRRLGSRPPRRQAGRRATRRSMKKERQTGRMIAQIARGGRPACRRATGRAVAGGREGCRRSRVSWTDPHRPKTPFRTTGGQNAGRVGEPGTTGRRAAPGTPYARLCPHASSGSDRLG